MTQQAITAVLTAEEVVAQAELAAVQNDLMMSQMAEMDIMMQMMNDGCFGGGA